MKKQTYTLTTADFKRLLPGRKLLIQVGPSQCFVWATRKDVLQSIKTNRVTHVECFDYAYVAGAQTESNKRFWITNFKY